MISETTRKAIELCYSKLDPKGYTSTVMTDFSKAEFNHITTGKYVKVKAGDCCGSALDIDISPVTERIRNLTTYKFKHQADDEIEYAVDHRRGAGKIVRCWLYPNKVSVMVAPHQAEDVAAIVGCILRAMD
jgi:hypothetical protein